MSDAGNKESRYSVLAPHIEYAWHIEYADNMLKNKTELLQLCKKYKPQPKYVIDEMLRSHGHECIRLQPYHADLNIIELVWAKVKRSCRAKFLG